MSSKGWIKLSRDMADHWLWKEKPFNKAQAWIDLLMHASHSDNQKLTIKGVMVRWGRGQQIRSKLTLANAWGWDRKKVDRFLKLLEEDGMITQNSGHLTTIISVCNYNDFQSSGASNAATDDAPDDTTDDTPNAAPDDAQIRIKELKNDQEGKEISNLPAKADSRKSDVVEIFEYWKQVMGKNDSAKLVKKRESAVKARIKEGYTVDQIKKAIYGCSVTPFNMGQNSQGKPWNDLELICRDGGRLEGFIESFDNPPVTQPQPQQRTTKNGVNDNEWVDDLLEGDLL